MESITIQDKTIILQSGEKEDTLLLFHVMDEKEASFFLPKYPSYPKVLIYGNDWEKDFTPYPHKRVFHGGKDFQGGSDLYQKELREEILPTALRILKIRPKRVILIGYSLAGLFSLEFGYTSSLITDICCCSGSLWYPGYLEHLKSLPVPNHLHHIYLSLGKKESITKNPYLSKAMDAMVDTDEYFNSIGIPTHFQVEEGGHFDEVEERQMRGISYLLSV